MAEEAIEEPVSLGAPCYSILEKHPTEALAMLLDYIDELKELPSSEAVSEKYVQANIMAAEIARQNKLNLDFELKGYILKAGKRITVTRRERVIYNFSQASEAIFRMRSRSILKTRTDESFLQLSRSTAEEIRRQLETLRKEIGAPPATEDAKATAVKRGDLGSEIAHWLRSSYDVILSSASEADEAPETHDSEAALQAIERLETLIFGQADAAED